MESVQKLKINVILLLLIVALPATSQNETSSSKSYSISAGTGKTVYRTSSNGFWNEFELETRGVIEVTDDDRDIKSISSGGYFELSKITFGNRRTIEIHESNGELIKKYYEGRKEISYDPSGKEWLADVLPDVLRSTGVAAKSRVNRIYRRDGVQGVISEMEKMRSE